jgi:hypothetical protein
VTSVFHPSVWRGGLLGALLCWPAGAPAAPAEDFAARCAARAAVERVYYHHRLGTKPPFEQALPPAAVARLVRLDLKKESVLREVYGVAITPEMVAAEVRRIDTTTRAPAMLAEIKAALDNDPAKFAEVFAKPTLVERALAARFENDNALHAPQRTRAEAARARLLATAKDGAFKTRLAALKAHPEGTVEEFVRWELTARPAEPTPPPAASPPTESETNAGPYTNKATAQLAQVLSSPDHNPEEQDRKFFFEDLPEGLQQVLRVQLRRPGDVSAVIESPRAFQLYLAAEVSAEAIGAAVLTIPKLGFDQWLAARPEN